MVYCICLVLVLDTGDELRCGKECVFNNILTGSAEAAFPFHNLMGLPIVLFRIPYETMARHSSGDKVIMNGIFMKIGLIMGWVNCFSTIGWYWCWGRLILYQFFDKLFREYRLQSVSWSGVSPNYPFVGLWCRNQVSLPSK
jgi:hypothetical protein